MAEESFKERARQEMIKAAKQYKDIYVDYEYLICSVTFEKNDYYIIAAEEDNFQHLTGVQSKIDAKTFFRKCYHGTLAEVDFDFAKAGHNEKSAKNVAIPAVTETSTCAAKALRICWQKWLTYSARLWCSALISIR